MFEKQLTDYRFAQTVKMVDYKRMRKIQKNQFFSFLIKRLISTVKVIFVLALYTNSAYAQDTTAVETDTAQQTIQPADAGAVDQAVGDQPDQAMIDLGAQLFKNNCAVCHGIQEQVVGPALAGINERRPADWIHSFVRNSQAVIQSGDAYAVELAAKFNNMVMPNFDLSDQEINGIVAYIQSEATKAAAPVASSDTTAVGQGGGVGGGIANQYLNAILVGLLVILALILVVLILIISVLTKFIKQKDTIPDEEKEKLDKKIDFKGILRNRGVVGIVAFIFLAVVVKALIDGLFNIGVQQGYEPTQPIKFSHKVHAGQYKIDCNYCHTTVQTSKSASIPSLNVCANCHAPGRIEKGVLYGDVEIGKVIQAYQNNTPIEWVRVHNLPDLAYFNHSQHVNVGGVECQTCHGPIQEMDVVQQSANLTMGWCIDCHATTGVNTDNEYYQYLKAVHADDNEDGKISVVEIGGTECGRCHY